MKRAMAVTTIAVAILLGLANPAEGAIRCATQATALQLSTVVPVILAPGPDGSTFLGANATGATTVLPRGSTRSLTLLTVKAASSQAELVGLLLAPGTDMSGTASAVITLAGVPQVIIENGVVKQASGAPVLLPPQGTAAIGGTFKALGSKPTPLTLGILARPASAQGLVLEERWTLAYP